MRNLIYPVMEKGVQIVQLNYKHMGQGEPLIVLHGLFGSLDNWATLGKRWAEDFSVYLIDLRNHGKSPHTPTHKISDMVADILELLDENGLESAHVLGHSMGGKVAMELALQHPDRVRSLIVADMGPQEYPRGHDDIFEALHSVDLSKMEKRSDIEDQLFELIPNRSIVYFLTKNAKRTKSGFRWKMNLDVLESEYEEILRPLNSSHPYEKQVLVLKGENSHYITTAQEPLMRTFFPQVKIVSIPGAGHWLHAEKPDLLYKSVLDFLYSTVG